VSLGVSAVPARPQQPDLHLHPAAPTISTQNCGTPVAGIAPVGAVVGGVLGALLGITAALIVVSVGILQAGVVLALSPVRSVVDVPSLPEDPALRGAEEKGMA